MLPYAHERASTARADASTEKAGPAGMAVRTDTIGSGASRGSTRVASLQA
ncbi:hypothetical protein [Curtobacterium sp. MCPF17_052]|nr:hypothetical protein [Curtobacterium sp. MCPF17_052]WIB13484.1 hypothetical protein DEJ36_06790 [Curtobacterium sp. MCPF17_052]